MARDGIKFVVFGIVIFFTGSILFYFTRYQALLILSIGALTGSLFCVYFFRDPERHPDSTKNITDGTVLSAADGRIVEIVEDSEDEYIQGKTMRISIFLSLFDIHINRIPKNPI